MNRHIVVRERAGDGTLYEVADLTGRVVSPYPMAYQAAVELAELRDADADMERQQLAVTERE